MATTNATTNLSDGDVERFRADGAICLRGVIDAAWLSVVAEAIEDDIANPGPWFHGYELDDGKTFHGNLRTWQSHDGFRRYCTESPLPVLAQRLMGSQRVNLFYDQLFVKEAATNSPTRWHNDQPYWPVRGADVMSFWLAIDPVDLTNGGLEFVAGSHTWDRWFQPESFGRTEGSSYDRNPDYETMIDIESERDQHRILSWDMEPGDVIAFHAMAVHGAPPNLDPTRRRRGYTVRYTGDDAHYFESRGMSTPIFADYLTNGDPIGGEQFPQLLPV